MVCPAPPGGVLFGPQPGGHLGGDRTGSDRTRHPSARIRPDSELEEHPFPQVLTVVPLNKETKGKTLEEMR